MFFFRASAFRTSGALLAYLRFSFGAGRLGHLITGRLEGLGVDKALVLGSGGLGFVKSNLT